METNYDLKNTEAQINKGNSNNQNAKYLYIICIYLYCNLFTAMNLVGSTWHHYASFYRSTSWDSGHGISFWQPETKVVTSSGKLWKVATKVIFRRFHSWCAAMFIVRLFLSVSVCFICGFAKCLLCFQLRNNIWIFSVFFCIWDSLNMCWKVICGSRLARHVIDDANRGCRAKITWQIRNNTNLLEESKETKQKDQGHLNVLSDQDVKTCEKWNIGSWVQENILWIWHRSFKQSECSS